MDLYLLTDSYQKWKVVENYVSMIWTERYSAYGDFVLVIDPSTRSLYSQGRCLWQSNSDRIMVVDQVLEEHDDEGALTVTVTGKSMEAILETRVLESNRSDNIWSNSGLAGYLVVRMVEESCISGKANHPEDVIPELYRNYADDVVTPTSVAVKPGSLYEAIRSVCEAEGLGFRIQLRTASPFLRFNVYKGDDRPSIVFGSQMDTLTSTSRLKSNKEYKNICYVRGKNGVQQTVSATGVSVYITGKDRRVMYLDASDVDPDASTPTQYAAELRQRGREALVDKKRQNLFDGEFAEIDPSNRIAPCRIGDKVSLMDRDGYQEQVRVSEFIWSHDQNGLKFYLTFEEPE